MNILDNFLTWFLSFRVWTRLVEYLWYRYHIARLNSVTNCNHRRVFETIDREHLDIKSDFSRRDAKALENVVQRVLRDNVTIVEVGSWKGMSTAILAKAASDFQGKVFAVDHWHGSDGVFEHQQAKEADMLSVFRHNMQVLGVSDLVHPLVMTSELAASVFKDSSLDFVFIDADHRYSHVSQDIEMWLPKVKRKGIIAGHDCEGHYTTFGNFRREVDAHREEDVIVGVCHAGVVKALFDVFGNDYNIEPDSSIWWHRKV